MTGKVAQVTEAIRPDTLGGMIAQLWDKYQHQRQSWVSEQQELLAYLYATDTSKTSNAQLPWRNTSVTPKLTQIMDNLHANYKAALFPNDDWLKWEGYTLDDATKEKREAIEFYMKNKTRLGEFMSVIDNALYDFIIYGNAFGDCEWVKEYKEDPVTGEKIPGYIGPRAVRVSPLDHVINPAAVHYKDSPKLTRKLISVGELKDMIETDPSQTWVKEAFEQSRKVRHSCVTGYFTSDDFPKSVQYSLDGFGNLFEYYSSPYVELIEFEGDLYDPIKDQYFKNHIITVMDRTRTVRMEQIPSWKPKGTRVHSGWRKRPDNIYAMGPLHNLVGLQYRIDHLENLKADVFDLIAFPPIKITGDVEEFTWGPGEEIHIDEGGNVEMLAPDSQALNADIQIQILEQRMEDYAGAPKQAMGIRTPGEKTAYEVQALESAAGRIFKEKVECFQQEFLEPLLNSMLETAVRNLDVSDTIRVFDDELSEEVFLEITKEDITANGKLRPIGARHFFNQQQMVQNLTGLFSSPVGQMIAPHVSSKNLALLVEDLFGLERYDIIEENVAMREAANTQRSANVLQEQLAGEDAAMQTLDAQQQ